MHDGQQRLELPKTVRESGAEAVAFTGRAATKLETGTAASDYIRLYRGDVDTLTASLERIQRKAAKTIDAITVEDEIVQSEAA